MDSIHKERQQGASLTPLEQLRRAKMASPAAKKHAADAANAAAVSKQTTSLESSQNDTQTMKSPPSSPMPSRISKSEVEPKPTPKPAKPLPQTPVKEQPDAAPAPAPADAVPAPTQPTPQDKVASTSVFSLDKQSLADFTEGSPPVHRNAKYPHLVTLYARNVLDVCTAFLQAADAYTGNLCVAVRRPRAVHVIEPTSHENKTESHRLESVVLDPDMIILDDAPPPPRLQRPKPCM